MIGHTVAEGGGEFVLHLADRGTGGPEKDVLARNIKPARPPEPVQGHIIRHIGAAFRFD